MQIKISARHGHISEEHRTQIQAKAEKLLNYFDRITMIEVIVDLNDSVHKEVEVLVDAEHKHNFVASNRNTDLLLAVDGAVDRVKQQIHRYKEKIQEHHRGSAHKAV